MEIVPKSKPPEVPEEGYIDQMEDAGVDQERIDHYQQGKFYND